MALHIFTCIVRRKVVTLEIVTSYAYFVSLYTSYALFQFPINILLFTELTLTIDDNIFDTYLSIDKDYNVMPTY